MKKSTLKLMTTADKISFAGTILVWCVTLPILSLITGPLAFIIAPVCIVVGLGKIAKYVEEK